MMNTRISILFLILCYFGLVNSCTTIHTNFDRNEYYYTAHNLWYENPKKIDSINYKIGDMIPVGTRVIIIKIYKNPHFYRHEYNYIQFRMPTSNRVFKLFVGRYQRGLTISELFERTFTTNSYKSIALGFNKKEIDAIKSGVAVEGMSKQAVLVTLGFPPRHHTKSIDSNTWIYFVNRWNAESIYFDREGKSSASRHVIKKLIEG